MHYFIKFDESVPVNDILKIEQNLNDRKCCIFGYISNNINELDFTEFRISSTFEDLDTIFLADRNIISRMSQIAKDGTPRKRNSTSDIAIEVMAYAQAANIDIEPGLAFHELAHRLGNEIALEELAWFRAADKPYPDFWINLARNKITAPFPRNRPEIENKDLTHPLDRWVRNHIVMLKVAELSLTGGRAVNSVFSLLDWMIDDFILAGPAFLYGAKIFGPLSSSRGMLKGLRSPNRDLAIHGIKNATWDVTYLSEFGKKIENKFQDGKRYILVTADRSLAEISSMIFNGPKPTDEYPSLEESLRNWWPEKDAEKIANKYFQCIAAVEVGRNVGAGCEGDPLGDMIKEGEDKIRRWQPK